MHCSPRADKKLQIPSPCACTSGAAVEAEDLEIFARMLADAELCSPARLSLVRSTIISGPPPFAHPSAGEHSGLVQTGAKPQGTCGFEAFGLSSTQLKAMATQWLQAAGCKTHGRSKVALFHLEFGLVNHPCIALRSQQLWQFVTLWRALLAQEKSRATRA